ncbi:protein of unknown function [Pararobbsia alpina]
MKFAMHFVSRVTPIVVGGSARRVSSHHVPASRRRAPVCPQGADQKGHSRDRQSAPSHFLLRHSLGSAPRRTQIRGADQARVMTSLNKRGHDAHVRAGE